jgi:cation/acetate symporter
MVLGIFWTGTSRKGAVAGMLMGLGLTIYYMVINAAPVRTALGLSGSGLWFGIQPVSAGVFGVFAGIMITLLVSFISRRQSLVGV